MEDRRIIYADQEYIDACKKRIGANPKSFTQLRAEGDWDALKDNFWKLRHAQRCVGLGTLILTNGAEL